MALLKECWRIFSKRTIEVLHLHSMTSLIVDASYVDKKKRSIFDMKELQQPLMRLLHRKEIKERYGQSDGHGPIHLLFF